MAGIINSFLLSSAGLGLKNSNASVIQAFKGAIQELDSKNIPKQKSPVGLDEVIGGQTAEILNNPGGVSGFVEENFQNPNFNNLPITSPSLIKNPEDVAVVSNTPDTEFFDKISNLKKAQTAFQNSVNVSAKAQENENGKTLKLFDQEV